MATKNLVPRADNEGNIGLSTKKWAGAHFASGTFDELKTLSLKSQDGQSLIQNDDGQSAVRLDENTGIYYISGGSSSGAEADKIIKNDTSVTAIDDSGSNPSKIEFKVDDTLKWTLDVNAFIPESGLDIGTEDKRLDKLYIDNDGLLSIGTSQLKVTSNKLQLSNNSGTNFYDLATTSDLSNYVQVGSETSQNLQSVLTTGSTATTSATINNVIVGSNDKEITLDKLVSLNNDNISIVPHGTGVTQIGGTQSGTDSVDIKTGEINIKTGNSDSGHIKLYKATNNYYTKLQANNTITENKTLNLPVPAGSDGTLALQSEVNAIASGIKAQQAVRVATTTNGTLASAYEDGQTVDDIVLATGDRILLKDQSTGSENGIYTVNASGAPTRATDFAANAQVAGYFVFIQEGTSNADTGWLCTNDAATDTVGTDPLVFNQFTSAGQALAGTGLTKTVNTFNVDASQTQITAVGTLGTLTVSGASDLQSDITVGGTSTFNGNLILKDSDDTNSITIKTPATGDLTANYSLTLPPNDGNQNQVLKTDGNGVLAWVDQVSGGLASVSADSAPTLGGNLTINSKEIVGSLIPATDSTYDLGSTDKKWSNLYSDNISFGDYSVSHNTSNSKDELLIVNDSTASNPSTVLTLNPKNSTTNHTILNLIGDNLYNSSIINFDNTTGSKTAKIVNTISTWNNLFSGINFIIGDTLPRSGSHTITRNSITDLKLSIGTDKINVLKPLYLRGESDSDQGKIRFYEAVTTLASSSPYDRSNYIEIQGASSLDSNYTLTLPSTRPSTNQILVSNSDGVLSWASQSTQFTISTLTGNETLLDTDKIAISAENETGDPNKNITAKNAKKYFLGLKADSDISIDTNTTSANFSKATIKDNKVTKSKIEQIASMRVLGNLTSEQADVAEVTVSSSTDLGGSSSNDTTIPTQSSVKTYIDNILLNTITENSTSYTLDDNNLTVSLDDNAYNNETIINLNFSNSKDATKSPIIFMPQATISRIGQEITLVITPSENNVRDGSIKSYYLWPMPNLNDPQMLRIGLTEDNEYNAVFNFTSTSSDFKAVTTSQNKSNKYDFAIQSFNVNASITYNANDTYSLNTGNLLLTDLNFSTLRQFTVPPLSYRPDAEYKIKFKLKLLNKLAYSSYYFFYDSALNSGPLLRNTGNTNNVSQNSNGNSGIIIDKFLQWERQ